MRGFHERLSRVEVLERSFVLVDLYPWIKEIYGLEQPMVGRTVLHLQPIGEQFIKNINL